MALVTRRILVSAVLIAIGWVVGRAQVIRPDFEIQVTAPAGRTTVTCTRGCTLAWVERGQYEEVPTATTFSYACGGSGALGCESGAIGGWTPR
jgi:hypothetical protein